MPAQVEDEHPAARPQNARGFLDGLRRIGRMVQRLREQRHVDRGVLERQRFHLATLPADVLHAAPLGERFGAFQHVGRSIDADDAFGPLRRFNSQVSFPARDIGDINRWQQQAECPRPGRPASARHELGAVGAVHFEVLLAKPDHLLQPSLVAADGRGLGGAGKLGLQRRPEAADPAIEQGRGEAIEGESAAAFLDDKPRFLQEPQMA